MPGVVFEISVDDMDRIEDWELVDFGWYKSSTVSFRSNSGRTVSATTVILGEDQQFDHEVNGLNYDIW